MRRPAGWKLALGYAVLVAFALIYIYPFLIQIATSFKTDAAATDDPLSLVPNPVDLTAWKRIFGIGEESAVSITRWLGNSVAITLVELGLDLPGVSTALNVERGMALLRRKIDGTDADAATNAG